MFIVFGMVLEHARGSLECFEMGIVDFKIALLAFMSFGEPLETVGWLREGPSRCRDGPGGTWEVLGSLWVN